MLDSETSPSENAPASDNPQQVQSAAIAPPVAPTNQENSLPPSEAVPYSGKRQAFRGIGRQLTETDLASPGVQKMLLEELRLVDDKCEELESFCRLFHEVDKKAAVLEEKLKKQNAFENLYTVSFGLGCAIIGLAPFYWSDKSNAGQMTLGVGLILAIGAFVAKAAKR
ncbi:MAG TPA: hypothetical protein VH079_02150 [Terriglobales bacterium]|jgi:hypothetical protein|nr:hypothetical protein [Terriglobales bacterium]